MRCVCIVTNFNYERFLGSCLESVLAQTHPVDRILLVDDGSTDGSVSLIESYARRFDRIEPIIKANGGQLSCFNAVVEHIDDADLVLLIDADDIYPPDYVSTVVERLSRVKADFCFADVTEFSGSDEPSRQASCAVTDEPDVEIVRSSALTRLARSWIGSPTSALAMRGHVFRSLFPYPHEADWVTRADDVIIFGASILGASKLYMPSVRIGYRVHGQNSFFQRPHTDRDEVIRKLALERLMGHYCHQLHIDRRPQVGHALDELLLIPRGLRRRFLVAHQPWKLLFIRLRMGIRNLRRAIRRGPSSRAWRSI